MQKVTIFNSSDPEQVILNELIITGLIGVRGGRLAVRGKLDKVQDLIDSQRLEGYRAHSTMDHPDTELGYGYDANRYELQEAMKLVTKSYERKLPNNVSG